MKNNTKITPEQKRQYIGYGIIGFLALLVIVYAANDFGSDEKNQKVEDFSTPESEANKYNSKLEAINGGKEQDTTINGDLLNYSGAEEKDTVTEIKQKLETINEDPILAEIKTPPRSKNKAKVRKNKKEVAVTPVEEIEITEPTTSQNTASNNKINYDNINSFFKSGKKKEAAKENIIYASIKGDQMGIKNNQRVTLILNKEVVINDKVFAKNSLVYAKATFSENRVNLSVSNINQVPMSLLAYDVQDGNLGLQVSQSLVNETTNGIVDNQADELGVSDIPVVGRTLNRIVKKKVREIKVDFLNNQKVILKPTNR